MHSRIRHCAKKERGDSGRRRHRSANASLERREAVCSYQLQRDHVQTSARVIYSRTTLCDLVARNRAIGNATVARFVSSSLTTSSTLFIFPRREFLVCLHSQIFRLLVKQRVNYSIGFHCCVSQPKLEPRFERKTRLSRESCEQPACSSHQTRVIWFGDETGSDQPANKAQSYREVKVFGRRVASSMNLERIRVSFPDCSAKGGIISGRRGNRILIPSY